MIIKVTQEDIDKGIQKDCEQCPIARAMRRAFGCNVQITSIIYRKNDGILAYGPHGMPDIVTSFIRDFDSSLKVTPFEFEVDDEL